MRAVDANLQYKFPWPYVLACMQTEEFEMHASTKIIVVTGLKGHWTSLTSIFLYLVPLRIVNQTNTENFMFFCHCVFIL